MGTIGVVVFVVVLVVVFVVVLVVVLVVLVVFFVVFVVVLVVVFVVVFVLVLFRGLIVVLRAFIKEEAALPMRTPSGSLLYCQNITPAFQLNS